MTSKTFRIIQEERDKQQRQRAKDLEQEVEYVDSARNISVVLDSGDLSEDFESHGIDSGKRDKCGPNSKMLHRLAKYYAGKKETNLAMAALEEAQSLVVEEKDKDFSLQVTEARPNNCKLPAGSKICRNCPVAAHNIKSH